MQNPTEEQLRWQLQQAREALAQMIAGTEHNLHFRMSIHAKARLNAKRVMELIK